MPKPTKTELAKYRAILTQQLAILRGDVGSMKDEALRASEQDNSVDHLADQGTDNYDQSFLLGLIENEEETIQLIVAALERVDGKGEVPYGQCVACAEESNAEAEKAKNVKPVKAVKGAKPAKATKAVKKPAKQEKPEPWIPKDRLEYIPWARYCVRHQEDEERNRNIA
jgi:RNA polymerase-binding transcription factor DksA